MASGIIQKAMEEKCMNKEIYCYLREDTDYAVLEQIAETLNIAVYPLDDGMMDKTVSEILQHPQKTGKGCTRFDLSFMLLNNIDDDDLKSLHEQTTASFQGDKPVKMMVTEHNRTWPLAYLFEEVSKEHRLFAQVEEISAMMKKLNDVNMTDWDNAKKEKMKMAVMKAYILLNSGNFTEQNVEESYTELKELTGE